MKLYHSTLDEKITTIEEKMIDMVVAYELIEQKKLSEPRLTFGSDEIKGYKNIIAYLEDLHRDMEKGYFCSC